MIHDQRTARIRTMAIRSLAACSTRKGIVAGTSHFYQIWTRDACFALWGSIAVKDYDTVKISLTRLTDSIDADGKVPLRIGNKNLTIPFLKKVYYKKILKKNPYWFKSKMKLNDEIVYDDDKNQAYALDSSLLLIIAWGMIKQFFDPHIFEEIATKERLTALEKAFDFIKKYEKFGLIHQKSYSDWADSLKREGYSSYNNILYYGAAMSLLSLSSVNKLKYEKKAEELKELINKRLWKNNKYVDFLDSYYISPNFTLDANMLAIIFNICNEEKRKKIIRHIDNNKQIVEQTGITTYPFYAQNHISRFIKIIGMKKYHNGMQWLWISGLTMIALQIDNSEKNMQLVNSIVQQVDSLTETNREDHAFINEVYWKGKPFSNLVYSSEEPFAWSSGMLLAALDPEERTIHILRSMFHE